MVVAVVMGGAARGGRAPLPSHRLEPPTAANNLVDEFAKHAKKSVVVKAMEELEKNGSIQKKMFGKIKIYLSDQRNDALPPHRTFNRRSSNAMPRTVLLG